MAVYEKIIREGHDNKFKLKLQVDLPFSKNAW